MVSRRLWIPDDELKADRVSQAQKMLGDAFGGLKDAAGSAAAQVGETFKQDRLGWAQQQFEHAFSPLRQAPQPEPLPEPEPEPPAPTLTPPTPSPMASTDVAPAAPSASLTASTPPMVHTGPVPGVDIPDDDVPSPGSSGEPPALEEDRVKPWRPPTDNPLQRVGDAFSGLGSAAARVGEIRDAAVRMPARDFADSLGSRIGSAASDLGTKANELGFRAPGADSKGILGNTGLGERVREADRWSQDLGETYTPKALSADEGLFGRQGPLQKALNPDVSSNPDLAGLKLGLETTGYPAMAKGAVRTGADWLKALDTLGTGLNKVGRGDLAGGALDTGMGAIGAVAPQFTFIGNAAAERARELGLSDEQAETVGAVVGFLTPGGGAEQVGKAGAFLNRTQPLTQAGRLGGAAERLARVTGNIAETPEELAKLGALRSLLPAAAMGVAAPVGGVIGAKQAAERGDGAGDVALAGLGGAFRAADIVGGVSELGLGAGAKALQGARGLSKIPDRLRGASDGSDLLRIVPGADRVDGVDGAPDGLVDGELPAGRDVFHGSGRVYDTPDPKKFPRPNAYGRGTYYSEDPLMAEDYSIGSLSGVSGPANETARAGLEIDQTRRTLTVSERMRDEALRDAEARPEYREQYERQAKFASDMINRSQERLTELEQRLDRMSEGREGEGPNTRRVRLPDQMRFLDLTEAMTPNQADELLGALGRVYGPRVSDAVRAELLDERGQVRVSERPSGPGATDLYNRAASIVAQKIAPGQTQDAMGIGREAINRALRTTGYDGIRFLESGLRNSGIYKNFVVFPQSQGKVVNALSGRRFGVTPDGADAGRRNAGIDAAGALVGGIAGGIKGDQYDEEDTGLTRAGRIVGGALGGATAGALARRGVQDIGRIGKALAGDEVGEARFGIKPTDMSPEDQTAYERGWRASARGAGPDKGGRSPLERADDRGEKDAWYQGYQDRAAERPKWSRGEQAEAPTPEATDVEGAPSMRAEARPADEVEAADVPLTRGEEMAAEVAAAEAKAEATARKPSEAVQRQEAAIAEAAALNPEGGTGQGATNPTVRATGPDSPGNLPQPRQRPGAPAGSPRTDEWDEATMGTRPTSEFESEDVDIPSIEALEARETPITMADAQAIMKRQAAKVRRDGIALDELRTALPDHPALGYLTKNWEAEKARLPFRQQAVRELAQANARAGGEVQAGLETNVQRESNRVARRKANRASQEAEDRAAVLGEATEGEGAEGTSTDVAGAVEDAGGKVQETEAGDRVVDAEGRVVASETPAEVDLDGKPTTTTPPAGDPEAAAKAAEASISKARAKGDATPLTPEGGVEPGGVVEAGATVEAGARVGAGATVGKGADIGAGSLTRPGSIMRPGATAAPGMLRTTATTATTATTTPGTTGSGTAAGTTGSGSGSGSGKGSGTGKGKGKGSGTTPPKTPPTPQTPTPLPNVADTGWLDANGRLKPLHELEGTIRSQLESDFQKWDTYKKQLDTTKGDAARAQLTADYEASVEKMKATRAAQITGLSEQEVLALASHEVSMRNLMDRSVAYGATGKNTEYGARDFFTNYARANLIGANPITAARNAIGGVASLVWHPIEAAGSSVVDPIAAWRLARKGIDTTYDRRYGKEIKYLIDGYQRALPAALINMREAMDKGQAHTARGLDEQLLNQIKGGNRATTFMRQTTDTLLKPLTATDAFFRTLTQGGELMRQSYRQMKANGMSDAQIDAEQIKLLQAPRADYVNRFGEMDTDDLAKGIQKQVDYRAFAQGTGEDRLLAALQAFQQKPGGSLILPFVTTPYNAAKFDLERSPVGFAKALKDLALPPEQKVQLTGSVGRRMNAKMESPDLTVGELSDRISRGLVGSALFAGLLGGAISGRFDINGKLPASQAERDEWEAQGRKPYTIRIADRYVSFQDIPGLNASLTSAALVRDMLGAGKGEDEVSLEIGKGILEAIRSLAARPMAGGLLDLAQNVGSPDQSNANLATSLISPTLPLSGLSRTVTTAMDKMQRERPETPMEAVARVYDPKLLPVKNTAWGDEMGNQNFGLPGVANPFRTSAAYQFDAPTKYVTSNSAATDVAIGKSKAKVDAYKRDPVNQPMPDIQDFINAQLATAAKDPYVEYLRSAETTRLSGEKAERKSRTLEDWLAEPVRR